MGYKCYFIIPHDHIKSSDWLFYHVLYHTVNGLFCARHVSSIILFTFSMFAMFSKHSLVLI